MDFTGAKTLIAPTWRALIFDNATMPCEDMLPSYNLAWRSCVAKPERMDLNRASLAQTFALCEQRLSQPAAGFRGRLLIANSRGPLPAAGFRQLSRLDQVIKFVRRIHFAASDLLATNLRKTDLGSFRGTATGHRCRRHKVRARCAAVGASTK